MTNLHTQQYFFLIKRGVHQKKKGEIIGLVWLESELINGVLGVWSRGRLATLIYRQNLFPLRHTWYITGSTVQLPARRCHFLLQPGLNLNKVLIITRHLLMLFNIHLRWWINIKHVGLRCWNNLIPWKRKYRGRSRYSSATWYNVRLSHLCHRDTDIMQFTTMPSSLYSRHILHDVYLRALSAYKSEFISIYSHKTQPTYLFNCTVYSHDAPPHICKSCS